MKHTFFIRLALVNTFKKKVRVLLAIGGIALTSSVIIVLFGLQMGLRNLVDNEIKQGQSQNIVTVTMRNTQAIKLDSERVSDMQSITGVSDVAESVGVLGTGTYHGISLNAPVYSVTDNYFAMNPTAVLEGNVESLPSGNSIVVSTRVLDAYGIKQADAIGKEVGIAITLAPEQAEKLEESKLLTSKNYTIRAVVDRGDLPVIYTPIEDLRTQGLTSVSQVSIQLVNPDTMAAVRQNVEQMGLQTASIQDTIEQIDNLFGVINSILVIFGFIVFIITVSATFTIITLTLMEETRQIGFLRIMGLRHSDVSLLFIIQSIVITLLGALFGSILGIIGGFVLNGYARVLAEDNTFSGEISVFAIPVIQIILILILAVIIGWVVGMLPAKRAIRLNPLEEISQ